MRKVIVAEQISLDGVIKQDGASLLTHGSGDMVRQLLQPGWWTNFGL